MFIIKDFINKLITTNKLRFIVILGISSLYCLLVLFYRFHITSSYEYSFLLWNLFLAWIPYIISIIIRLYYEKIKPSVLLYMFIFIWLIFQPNAAYLVSDLHLLDDPRSVPFWYDLIVLFSFAWTGMMLDFFSLFEMHDLVTLRTNNKVKGWIFIIVAIILLKIGIFFGAFLRWNSWDVFIKPLSLYYDFINTIKDSYTFFKIISICVFSASFHLITYITFRFMAYYLRKNQNGKG